MRISWGIVGGPQNNQPCARDESMSLGMETDCVPLHALLRSLWGESCSLLPRADPEGRRRGIKVNEFLFPRATQGFARRLPNVNSFSTKFDRDEGFDIYGFFKTQTVKAKCCDLSDSGQPYPSQHYDRRFWRKKNKSVEVKDKSETHPTTSK